MGEQVVQSLGQGRVRKDSVLQRSVGQLAHDCRFEYGHDFAALDSQHSRAQDLIGVGVDDGFQEAAAFIQLQGTGDVIHGHPGYADFAVLAPRFLFV